MQIVLEEHVKHVFAVEQSVQVEFCANLPSGQLSTQVLPFFILPGMHVKQLSTETTQVAHGLTHPEHVLSA